MHIERILNHIDLSWYNLQAVVDDIATTSLAANVSQNSNDLLVLHSFQEEY